VDFRTAKIVADQRVRVHGPVSQGEFLTALGIVERAKKLKETATEKQEQDIDSALQRLTALSQMGGLFKVMGFTPQESTLHVAGFHEEEIDEIPDDES